MANRISNALAWVAFFHAILVCVVFSFHYGGEYILKAGLDVETQAGLMATRAGAYLYDAGNFIGNGYSVAFAGLIPSLGLMPKLFLLSPLLWLSNYFLVGTPKIIPWKK